MGLKVRMRALLASAWVWSAGLALAPALALLILCGFGAVGLLSRALGSLALKDGLLSLWIVLLLLWGLAFGLWVLLSIVGMIVAVVSHNLHKSAAQAVLASGAAVLGCGVGLALSPACVHRLAYPDERAVEDLINEFDPVVHAISSYEADHGRAPDALTDLIPHYLPEIPHPDVIGTTIKPRYDRLERDWRLEAGAYLMHGLPASSPYVEAVYLGSQDYANGLDMAGGELASYEHWFHGWRWHVDD